jgi:hypothetical protein
VLAAQRDNEYMKLGEACEMSLLRTVFCYQELERGGRIGVKQKMLPFEVSVCFRGPIEFAAYKQVKVLVAQEDVLANLVYENLPPIVKLTKLKW